MRIIHIITGGQEISIQLTLTAGQAALLQRQKASPLVKKLLVEIARHKDNSAAIIELLTQNKSLLNAHVGLMVSDDDLSPDAFNNPDSLDSLLISGGIVVVPFEVKNGRLLFDLDALGLVVDERGRLQVQRVAGFGAKK